MQYIALTVLSDVEDSDEVQNREEGLDSEQSLLPIHTTRRQNQRIAEGGAWKWLAQDTKGACNGHHLDYST